MIGNIICNAHIMCVEHLATSNDTEVYFDVFLFQLFQLFMRLLVLRAQKVSFCYEIAKHTNDTIVPIVFVIIVSVVSMNQ